MVNRASDEIVFVETSNASYLNMLGLLPGQRAVACLQAPRRSPRLFSSKFTRTDPLHSFQTIDAQKVSSLAPQKQTCSRLTSDRLRSQKRSSASLWTDTRRGRRC